MDNKIQIILNQENKSNTDNKNITIIVSKLEKIKLLEKKAITLDEKIETIKIQVNKETQLAIKKIQKAKEDYILLLIKKYELKSLTKWQKEITTSLINDEVEILDTMGILSDEMKDRLQKLKKIKLDNMSNFEKEFAKEMMKNMMKDAGIDYDIDKDFTLDDIFEDDFFENISQKFHEEHSKNEEEKKYKQKKETNKNTDINFQKIYKSLIKLCHPDLSKNSEEKRHNEELTKKLTVVWRNRDYYELLILWLEIDPMNSLNLEINKENQKNIIKNLTDKILHLEHQDRIKKFHNKDTAFYYQFNAPSKKGTETKIKKYNKDLLENAKSTNNLLSIFKKTTNFKDYLAEIYDSQNDSYLFDFDDFD